MAKPQHTPGPWTVCKDGTGDTFISGPNAECIADLGIHDEERCDEDAHLLAAAPDLLAALKHLAEILEVDGGCPPCIGSMAPAEHHLGLAKAAIAKADRT